MTPTLSVQDPFIKRKWSMTHIALSSLELEPQQIFFYPHVLSFLEQLVRTYASFSTRNYLLCYVSSVYYGMLDSALALSLGTQQSKLSY